MKIRNIIFILSLLVVVSLPLNIYAEDISQDNTSTFKDISKYGWAKDAINYFGRANIISGDGKGNFFPSKNVTREEFATMLSRAFNVEASGSTQTFSDVPTTRWSYNFIESVKDYLTGYYPPKGKPFFDPNGDATREDVAVALAKMIGLSEDDLNNPNILEDTFTDADDVSFNLRGLMAVVVENKIMLGSEGKLRPTNPITRAEVATLLFKVMKSSVSNASEELKLDVDIPEVTTSADVCISGFTVAGAKVKINGYDAEVDSSGKFELNFTLKKEGEYSVEIIAVKNGLKAIENKTIKYEEAGPELVITKCPTNSNKEEVTIEGTVSNTSDDPMLTINDEPVYCNRFNYSTQIYTFSYNATLVEGTNEFKFVVKDNKGKDTTVTKTITYGVEGPELIITQCPETSTIKTITISGTVTDPNDSNPKVYINNEPLNNWGSSWSEDFALKEGKNKFVIKATNSKGKSTEITKEVLFTVGAPELIITQCPETSTNKTITISGTVTDSNDSNPKVYINNEPLNNWRSSWSEDFTLKEGKNTFVIKVTNSNGKSTEITKEVVFTVGAPEIIFTNCPEVINSTSVTISGKIQDNNDSNLKLYINDEAVSLNYYGEFDKTVTLLDGDNTFVIRAVNSFGKSQSIVKVIKKAKIEAPTLNVNDVPELISEESVTISGTVIDSIDSNVKLYVNDNLISSTNGAWSFTLKLVPGDNNIIIVATNKFEKSTTIVKKVKYEPVVQDQDSAQ